MGSAFHVSPPFTVSNTRFSRPAAKPCCLSRNQTRSNPDGAAFIFVQVRPDSVVCHSPFSVTIQPVESSRKNIASPASFTGTSLQCAPPSLVTRTSGFSLPRRSIVKPHTIPRVSDVNRKSLMESVLST